MTARIVTSRNRAADVGSTYAGSGITLGGSGTKTASHGWPGGFSAAPEALSMCYCLYSYTPNTDAGIH